MAVSHILGGKHREIITAASAESVLDVAGTLAKHKIGAVVVVDDRKHILGIISERDIVRLIATEGAAALSKPASELMTRNVRTCKVGDSETELMALMTQYRIRHLPVVQDDKLTGMISIGDVVKHRIEAIEREAEEMKAYIATAG